MIILGIDPGLAYTGFGIIDTLLVNKYIASGTIQTSVKASLAERIGVIVKEISSTILLHKPDIVSIEKVFVNINPDATLKLGQARGAIIAVCVLHNLLIYEYTALKIKKQTTGNGHATKSQVQKMIFAMLKMPHIPETDEADALAVALTHSQSNNGFN